MKNDLRKLDSVTFLTIDVKLESSKAFWNEDFKININESDILKVFAALTFFLSNTLLNERTSLVSSN